jgi:hypothetical protein
MKKILKIKFQRAMKALAKHSGPYPLSLVDRFNLWYGPIFEARR